MRWPLALLLAATTTLAGESTMPGERAVNRPAGAPLRAKCLALGPTASCSLNGVLSAISEGNGSGSFYTTYSSTLYSIMQVLRAKGTRSSPSAVATDDILGRVSETCGFDGTTFCGVFGLGDAHMRGVADGNFTSTSHPTRYEFYTTPSGSTTPTKQWAIRQDGTLEATKTLAKYNNVATAGYGVPAIVDYQGLTAQVADIADTNFTNAGTAGTYRVSYYLYDTTAAATAGMVTLNIKFNDGTTARTISSSAVVLTSTTAATSFTQGTIVIRLGSGNITYGTTHTGIFSTAAYAVYLTAERLN